MFKPTLKITMAFVIVLGGLIVSSPFSFGKVEYTKKEKKSCTVCHVAANKKDLNEVGKCYAEHGHSLEGCEKK